MCRSPYFVICKIYGHLDWAGNSYFAFYKKSCTVAPVMRSLTSLIPALAPIFGLTEKSLYERQKSLVRMKMLPTPTGRGRGRGAEATAENVALLIIAVLATDKQADDERVRKLAYAPFVEIPGGASNPGSRKKDRCPWTGATVFKDGL